MDFDQFCKHSKDMLDYVTHYFESVSKKCVSTNVYPGYLNSLLPEDPPNKGESFEKIMEDFEKCIMPGLVHWRHPGFLAYFPTVSSYPSILGTLIGNVFGCVGFTTNICPVGRELEAIVLDWYGKMVGLPDCFLRYAEGSSGGGLLQGTSGECVLVSMITARQNVLKGSSKTRFSLSKPMLIASLVAYCSKECHRALQKSTILTLVNLKILDTDEHFRLRGETLAKAIEEDKAIGLIPFFVNVTVGTFTGACDPIEEIGPICKEHGMWLNVDASYAGNALICPEYRHYFEGIEYASSITINPAKWLPIHYDSCAVFTQDLEGMTEYLIAERTTLGIDSTSEYEYNYSNKPFRVFKLWVVFRTYGIEGLQKCIRNHIELATVFVNLVREDTRFEVLSFEFGIVCFRVKDTDAVNKVLLNSINKSGKLLLNSHVINGKFAIRLVVCSEDADVFDAWNYIRKLANQLPAIYESENVHDEWTDCFDYALL